MPWVQLFMLPLVRHALLSEPEGSALQVNSPESPQCATLPIPLDLLSDPNLLHFRRRYL